MIAVIGAPSQSQFAEITGAQDDRIVLVGQVHQDLGALSGLSIFICDVMDFCVMADVLEVLTDRVMDRYFHAGDMEQIHQGSRIGMGALCRAEAWHRDSDDIF